MNTVLADSMPATPVSGLPELKLCTFGNADKTKGSILVLPSDKLDEQGAMREAHALAANFQLSYFLEGVAPATEQELLAARLAEQLEAAKMKRLTVIGLGRNAILAMHLTLQARELVRRLILVNPSSHKDSDVTSGLLARIDRLIPYGLPLSPKKIPDDVRAMAHRLRPPSLLLTTREAPGEMRAQAKFLEERMPNARRRGLVLPLHSPDGALSDEVEAIIREFMDVPAKRSQKNE